MTLFLGGAIFGLFTAALVIFALAVWLGSREPQQHRHYPCSEVKKQ